MYGPGRYGSGAYAGVIKTVDPIPVINNNTTAIAIVLKLNMTFILIFDQGPQYLSEQVSNPDSSAFRILVIVDKCMVTGCLDISSGSIGLG
jgi:hypothetical protein